MRHPNPRDVAELRESFQAIRLAVELLTSDAKVDREIPETLNLIIRAADRSLGAIERILADSDP